MKKWAENLVEDVFKKYQEKYSFWKYGFKIFYSPVFTNPTVAIIGFQPGGNESNYISESKSKFESDDFSLPERNEFFETEYKFSKRIRDLFNFNGGFALLEKSLVVPLVFFRAPSALIWNKDIDKNIRLEMEYLCILKMKEILEKTKPRKILILGLDTYSRFQKQFGFPNNEEIICERGINGSRMVIRSIISNYSVLAIIHPTGSRISNIDWNSIKEKFHNWITDEI